MSLDVWFIYMWTCDGCGKKEEETSDLSVTDPPVGWSWDFCSECRLDQPLEVDVDNN